MVKNAQHNMVMNDSLQGCLAYLVDHYGKRHTLTSLMNGLPLKDNKLTAQLFVRAARRAGLNAQVAARKLQDISPHVLPAVIHLENDEFAVLQGKTKDGDYQLINGRTGAEMRVGEAELLNMYRGNLILVRPSAATELVADTFATGREWFWQTLLSFKRLYIQVALAAVFINLMGLVSPLFIMNVYDRVVPNGAYETLWVLASGALIAYIFDFVFRQLRGYFIDMAGRGADILLASRIYSQVLNIRLGTQQASAGAFANQLREYESLREFFSSTTLVTLIDVPFIFLFIGVLALISGPLALVPLVAVPIVLFVCYAVQLPLRGLMEQHAQDLDRKHGHLVESLNGLESIKSLGLQSFAQARWEQAVGVAARLGTKTRFLAQLGIHFSLFMQQTVVVVLVIWGVYRITNGDMSIGALVASTILVGRTLAPLSQAVGLYVRYQQARIALTGLNNIMQAEVERQDGQEFVHIESFKGNMDFKGVDFHYPNSPMDSLSDVSFQIKAGEKIGLIGRAGSGKSTTSRLMLNLYNPSKGSILMDGVEIRQLDPAELRTHISYVPQNIVLFAGTLRENIQLANPQASDQDMLRAAEMAGVMEFVRRHPKGFDMPVGERGEGLSGGQRQAVAVARAFLRNGSVVILDDPTSEMDNRSEEIVKQGLNEFCQDKTVILITHRASMLVLVDRLIVMDYGQKVADGPKKAVLEQLKTGQVKGKN